MAPFTVRQSAVRGVDALRAPFISVKVVTDGNGVVVETASTKVSLVTAEANGVIVEAISASTRVVVDSGASTDSNFPATAQILAADTNGTVIESVVAPPVKITVVDNNLFPVETAYFVVPTKTTDAGTATESATVVAKPVVVETGVSTDSALLAAKPAQADVGSAVDTAAMVGKPVTSDSGSSSEISAPQVVYLTQDAGICSEILALNGSYTISDSNALSSDAATIVAQLLDSESVLPVLSWMLEGRFSVTDSSAPTADTATTNTLYSVADTGASSDIVVIRCLMTDVDYGYGIYDIPFRQAKYVVTDSGTATELIADTLLRAFDTGAGADAAHISGVGSSDTGHFAETIHIDTFYIGGLIVSHTGRIVNHERNGNKAYSTSGRRVVMESAGKIKKTTRGTVVRPERSGKIAYPTKGRPMVKS